MLPAANKSGVVAPYLHHYHVGQGRDSKEPSWYDEAKGRNNEEPFNNTMALARR